MFRSKRFFQMLFGILFVGLLAIFGSQVIIDAADHADSPDTFEGNLDINDVYVFSQGSNMVFAMTVSPLLAPGGATNSAAFNPNGLYQFKLDRERDGIEDAVIQVTFSGSGTSQGVAVRGPANPSITGPTGKIILNVSPVTGDFNTTFTGGGMTVFAGPRDDPFFFNGFGDESLQSVLNAAFTAAGFPAGDPGQQTLAFANPGQDDLAGLNVLAIVVEIPKANIANALGIGTSDTFYVWGTTSVRD